mmetsp:Transcript_74427/g.162812  ORF Transcript_74427/g.162812 Transcript_74427/m.162812 type:complete len:882 (-) Transcript_74427:79-2724(-)
MSAPAFKQPAEIAANKRSSTLGAALKASEAPVSARGRFNTAAAAISAAAGAPTKAELRTSMPRMNTYHGDHGGGNAGTSGGGAQVRASSQGAIRRSSRTEATFMDDRKRNSDPSVKSRSSSGYVGGGFRGPVNAGAFASPSPGYAREGSSFSGKRVDSPAKKNSRVVSPPRVVPDSPKQKVEAKVDCYNDMKRGTSASRVSRAESPSKGDGNTMARARTKSLARDSSPPKAAAKPKDEKASSDAGAGATRASMAPSVLKRATAINKDKGDIDTASKGSGGKGVGGGSKPGSEVASSPNTTRNSFGGLGSSGLGLPRGATVADKEREEFDAFAAVKTASPISPEPSRKTLDADKFPNNLKRLVTNEMTNLGSRTPRDGVPGWAQEDTRKPMGATQSATRSSGELPDPSEQTRKSEADPNSPILQMTDDELMERTKWERWMRKMDVQKYGAHYGPSRPELPSALAFEEPDKQDLDHILADMLHKHRPEEPVHPGVYEPKPAMTTAFTDRSLRLREGRHMRTTLLHNDPVPTEWGSQANRSCPCPTCGPEAYVSAGQPSHLLQNNLVYRCQKDVPPTAESHPTAPHWKNGFSNTFDSTLLGKSLPHNDETRAEVPADAEEDLMKWLGRKIKAPEPQTPGAGRAMMHRSKSCDAMVISAGQYDQERYGFFPDSRRRGRQVFQGMYGDEPARCAMDFVLSPRGGDPPAPTKIAAVVRNPGTFKAGFSADCARISEHYNQEHFRFADPLRVRGKSQPPLVRDPDLCGAPTGIVGNHMHQMDNPILSTGKGTTEYSLGALGNLNPKPSFRQASGNFSPMVTSVIDQASVARSFEAEKAWRMEAEPAFASLCAITAAVHQKNCEQATSTRKNFGQNTTDELKRNLEWME